MANFEQEPTDELKRILDSDAWANTFVRHQLSDEIVMHIEPKGHDDKVVAGCLMKIMSAEFLSIAGIDSTQKSQADTYVIGTVTNEWNVFWEDGKSYEDLVSDGEFDDERIAFIRHDAEDHAIVWERKGVEYSEIGVVATEKSIVVERILPFVPDELREEAGAAIARVAAD